MAAATSAGVMRAHFGARYTWPRRCCAGCRTAAADHLLLETMGCAAVGRSFVMSSNSTEAWDAQEWVVTELQHHPCRPFHPSPLLDTRVRMKRFAGAKEHRRPACRQRRLLAPAVENGGPREVLSTSKSGGKSCTRSGVLCSFVRCCDAVGRTVSR